MDKIIEKNRRFYIKKYGPYAIGGMVFVILLAWLGISNYTSVLKVDRRGLGIGEVKNEQFNDLFFLLFENRIGKRSQAKQNSRSYSCLLKREAS